MALCHNWFRDDLKKLLHPDDVDRLLVLLVDRRWQPAQAVRAGFDATFVDRVVRMVRRNQYKRRLPVIAKLTNRTMDRDFRYPRDWGT